jgi:hypothetical protein
MAWNALQNAGSLNGNVGENCVVKFLMRFSSPLGSTTQQRLVALMGAPN